MRGSRTVAAAVFAAAALTGSTTVGAGSAVAAGPQEELAAFPASAPYYYSGWGSPPDPAAVMRATGVRAFTMAFVLSDGGCTPAWDGTRPLQGGHDAAAIDAIRDAGGDVTVSFGGWGGTKLGEHCSTARDVAAAYEQVVDAYGLHAIDLDVESTEYSDTTVQQRIADALALVQAERPDVRLFVTIGTGQSGPDTGLLQRVHDAGVEVDAWTLMPFDFGGGSSNMAQLTAQAEDGLNASLQAVYGYSATDAYHHQGISSMNGTTDDGGELVSPADFTAMRDYASQHGLARFTFWSVNRDRPCSGGGADSCSGVDQTDWQYTSIAAGYTG